MRATRNLTARKFRAWMIRRRWKVENSNSLAIARTRAWLTQGPRPKARNETLRFSIVFSLSTDVSRYCRGFAGDSSPTRRFRCAGAVPRIRVDTLDLLICADSGMGGGGGISFEIRESLRTGWGVDGSSLETKGSSILLKQRRLLREMHEMHEMHEIQRCV
jgi:hypothetical protein